MLKFFFHRSSWMVRLVNLAVLAEILALAFLSPRWGLPMGWMTWLAISCWLSLNFFNMVPWYAETRGPDGEPVKLGIRSHFSRTMIPYLYILAPSFGLRLLGLPEAVLLLVPLLFLPLLYVNGILLYFHFRDRSALTPGYFSHNFYRKDEEPPCTP